MINVSTRFGGTEEEEEDGSEDEAQALRSSEDSINQGPWGLAAYAYYFWSGATDQVRPSRLTRNSASIEMIHFESILKWSISFCSQSDRFTRSWSAFMNVWNNH